MAFRSKHLHAAVLLGLGILIGIGLSLGPTVHANKTADTSTAMPWKDARLMAQVMERVKQDYVDPVSDDQLVKNALKGMLVGLDPHSEFLDESEFDELRITTSGEYSGVGIEINVRDDAVEVIAPIDDTPAARAGIKAGDIIVAVDDVPVDISDLSSTIDRMRGKTGSEVKLTITREGVEAPMTFVLKRSNVQVRSVKSQMLEPGLGYVRIAQFSDTTAADFDAALASLRKQNRGTLKGLVLDLRNNPGGVLEAAVSVADEFLSQGIIVTANGRAADARFEMDAKPGDALDGSPIVVLVDGGSASASEIVAGALKDHHRATLLGQKTYGKGSVQTIIPIDEGYALKLTTSRYYTPSGESIHMRGIVPDVVVSEQELQAEIDKTVRKSAPNTLLNQDYEVRLALDHLKADGAGKVRSAQRNDADKQDAHAH